LYVINIGPVYMKLHEYLHKLVLLSSKHENKLGQKKQTNPNK